MVRIIVVDDLIIFLHCLGIYVCTKHLAAPCGTLSSGHISNTKSDRAGRICGLILPIVVRICQKAFSSHGATNLLVITT